MVLVLVLILLFILRSYLYFLLTHISILLFIALLLMGLLWWQTTVGALEWPSNIPFASHLLVLSPFELYYKTQHVQGLEVSSSTGALRRYASSETTKCFNRDTNRKPRAISLYVLQPECFSPVDSNWRYHLLSTFFTFQHNAFSNNLRILRCILLCFHFSKPKWPSP